MPEHVHPPSTNYDVLSKWDSPSFDDKTREVLQRRLHEVPPRRFFDPALFAVLEAACARLLATPVGDPPIANWIDDDVEHHRGEGFRHPEMPPLQESWRLGLQGLDAEARKRHGAGFAQLDGASQDETLRALQRGEVDPAHFAQLPVQQFFARVLLKSVATMFYAQPQAWSEIGFGGPASPRGYVRIGLDRRDPWEAPLRPLGSGTP